MLMTSQNLKLFKSFLTSFLIAISVGACQTTNTAETTDKPELKSTTIKTQQKQLSDEEIYQNPSDNPFVFNRM